MTWNWDQGRLSYFQFDELRKVAKFALKNDLASATSRQLIDFVGLPFAPVDPLYPPWRNYGRVYKAALLVSLVNGVAQPTPLCELVASDGQVSSDEYFHFLATATTDPSPARQRWDHAADHRYPLLFALKFILARASVGIQTTRLDRIVSAYEETGFVGDEDDVQFLAIIYDDRAPIDGVRQAKESIKIMSQISYLSCDRDTVSVALDEEDAREIFADLAPISGRRLANGDAEIRRLASLFDDARGDLDFNYTNTSVSDTSNAGFPEGGKAEKTHLRIERNSQLRRAFFQAYPSTICDFCGTDTEQAYPWTDRVLDIHHLLPLCSGARTATNGTVLSDLVPNCPTCHRAVHSFYSRWLARQRRRDFIDAPEARDVYGMAKAEYRGRRNA